jgi:hypothetical protein
VSSHSKGNARAVQLTIVVDLTCTYTDVAASNIRNVSLTYFSGLDPK